MQEMLPCGGVNEISFRKVSFWFVGYQLGIRLGVTCRFVLEDLDPGFRRDDEEEGGDGTNVEG